MLLSCSWKRKLAFIVGFFFCFFLVAVNVAVIP